MATAAETFAISRSAAANAMTDDNADALGAFSSQFGGTNAAASTSHAFAAMAAPAPQERNRRTTKKTKRKMPAKPKTTWNEQRIRNAISLAHPGFGKLFNYHVQLLQADSTIDKAKYEYDTQRSIRVRIPPEWTNAQVIEYIYGDDHWGWDLSEAVEYAANNYGEKTNPLGTDKNAPTADVALHQDQLRRLRKAAVLIEGLLTDTVRSIPGGEGAYALYQVIDGKGYEYIKGRWVETVETTKMVVKTGVENPAAATMILIVGIDGKVLKHVDGDYYDTLSTTNRTPNRGVDKFRRTPNSLREKLAMDEAIGGAGERIMKGKLMSDPRFKGMEKWQHVHYNPDGTNTVIHFLRDPATGKFLDFKFK